MSVNQIKKHILRSYMWPGYFNLPVKDKKKSINFTIRQKILFTYDVGLNEYDEKTPTNYAYCHYRLKDENGNVIATRVNSVSRTFNLYEGKYTIEIIYLAYYNIFEPNKNQLIYEFEVKDGESTEYEIIIKPPIVVETSEWAIRENSEAIGTQRLRYPEYPTSDVITTSIIENSSLSYSAASKTYYNDELKVSVIYGQAFSSYNVFVPGGSGGIIVAWGCTYLPTNLIMLHSVSEQSTTVEVFTESPETSRSIRITVRYSDNSYEDIDVLYDEYIMTLTEILSRQNIFRILITFYGIDIVAYMRRNDTGEVEHVSSIIGDGYLNNVTRFRSMYYTIPDIYKVLNEYNMVDTYQHDPNKLNAVTMLLNSTAVYKNNGVDEYVFDTYGSTTVPPNEDFKDQIKQEIPDTTIIFGQGDYYVSSEIDTWYKNNKEKALNIQQLTLINSVIDPDQKIYQFDCWMRDGFPCRYLACGAPWYSDDYND